MTTTDYVINLILSVFLTVGAYQFYFWTQRNLIVRPRTLVLPIDEWIPYQPRWVWIYSFSYHPVILCVNLVVEAPRQFSYFAFSYLLLLGLQMVCFLAFPIVTPKRWRRWNTKRNRSERLLALVQSYDARSNCFPSMHTSVAMLTALHLYPTFGLVAFVFPPLIGLSCVFTKQHYVLDIPAGLLLGLVSFQLFVWLV